MLAWRLLWRDWRSGELRILMVALILAVTIVSSIGLFVERLHGGIVNRSSHFLAADRVLESPRPVDPSWLIQARSSELVVAKTILFQSMVRTEDRGDDIAMQLAAVKAVDQHYPVRGNLIISEQIFANADGMREVDSVTYGPDPGEVWLDAPLFSALKVVIGDVIYVGTVQLRVSKVLVSEPDRGANMFGLGPRVMMHWDNLEASGVVQPGSRVSYKYLFGGDRRQLESYALWLRPQLKPSLKWIDLKDSQPRIASAIQRAQSFLLLGGSLGVLLAAIAVSLAAHRFSDRHVDYVALMKSFGATPGKIKRIYSLNLLFIALVAIVVGWLLGWVGQQGFVAVIARLVPYELPPPGPSPLVLGALTGLVCLFSFALPPIWGLQKVPPLRVLRRDVSASENNTVATAGLGFIAIVALMYIYSGSFLLTAAVLLGVLVSAIILGGCAFVVLRSGSSLGMHAGGVMGLALANLRRRGLQNSFQVLIFSLAIMMFLMLTLVRTTLLEEWRMQLPPGTPNHFLVNVASHEVDDVRAWFVDKNVKKEPLYPMVRARLVLVNGQSLQQRSSELQRARAGVERQLNLTWTNQLPQDNEIRSGRWWTSDDQDNQVSVEADLADRLGIGVGDELGFEMASETFNARVSNIRSLRWDRMRPNFYMIFNDGVLGEFPATYMTSFYLPPQRKNLLNEFLQRYPTVTVLEMDAIMEQIRTIVTQVSSAIELVLGLIVAASALVLIASVVGSLGERFHESAILRTLGASRRLVLGSLVIEFAILGLVSGIFAVVGAECSAYLLQTEIFQMTPALHPGLWVFGPILGLVLITLIGYLCTRRVVDTPPLQVLNEVS